MSISCLLIQLERFVRNPSNVVTDVGVVHTVWSVGEVGVSSSSDFIVPSKMESSISSLSLISWSSLAGSTQVLQKY